MTSNPEVDSSNPSQFEYDKALREGTIPPRRLRLLMSGPSGCGKTSIVRSLLDEPFQPYHESTEGIRIDQHSLGPNMTFRQAFHHWYQSQHPQNEGLEEDEEKEDDNVELLEDTRERNLESFLFPSSSSSSSQQGDDDGISLSIWDFVGQTHYLSMHQVFFRPQCLYLLILDLQTDEMDRNMTVETMIADAHVWLNTIVASVGPSIGLVIVGTHADMFDTWSAAEDRLEQLMDVLEQRVADIEWDHVLIHAPSVVVDNRNGRGIVEFHNTVRQQAESMLNGMERIPLRWLRLCEELEMVHVDPSHLCVDLSTISERARRMGIVEESELVSALSYLDVLGDVLYIPNYSIQDWVFLQPHLLLDAMTPLMTTIMRSRHLTNTQQRNRKQLEEQGYLSNAELEGLWNEFGFQNQQQLRNVLSASGSIMDLAHGIVVPCHLADEETILPETVGEYEITVETFFTTHLPTSLFVYVLARMQHEHGMGKVHDISMMSQWCSCLVLDVPISLNIQDLSPFVFRVMFSVHKLSHSIGMTVLATPIGGHSNSSIQPCLVQVCLLLLRSLHICVKQRYPELNLASWSRGANDGEDECLEWCILESSTNDDGTQQSFRTECHDKFGIRHTLVDTARPRFAHMD